MLREATLLPYSVMPQASTTLRMKWTGSEMDKSLIQVEHLELEYWNSIQYQNERLLVI